MYTIGQIIYGYKIDADRGGADSTLHQVIDFMNAGEIPEGFTEEECQAIEDEANSNDDSLFKFYYSGSSEHSPIAIGIQVGEIDECQSVDVSTITDLCKDEVIVKFEKLVKELPPKIQALLPELRKPTFYILWTTS